MKIVTYNTFQEKNGHDPAIDALLAPSEASDAIVCLQEVRPRRALEIKRTCGSRAFISPAKSGLLYLAIVLPAWCCFLQNRTVGLNGYKGCIPAPWSLRHSYDLFTMRMPGWIDALETRVVQVTRVLNILSGEEFRLLNTHLPYTPQLRNWCLDNLMLWIAEKDVIIAGDFNATMVNGPLRNFCKHMGLQPTGWFTNEPTHDNGRKIDHVFCRGGFVEASYNVRSKDGLSDHRIVTVELEAKPGERA